MSLGYTLASTLLLGSWLGFINSAQQVFAEVFFVPKLFPIIFAACSICVFLRGGVTARSGLSGLGFLGIEQAPQ